MHDSYHDLINTLSQYMSEYRLNHVIRTAECAKELSTIWGVDSQKAYVAGLVHDIAKEMNPESVVSHGIVLEASENLLYKTFPSVWHAIISPKVIQHLLLIEDDEILSACQWHTTGKADMTLLEQVIFVADALEPERQFDHIQQVRDYAIEDLNLAVYALSLFTMSILKKKGVSIFEDTSKCAQFYEQHISKENGTIIRSLF